MRPGRDAENIRTTLFCILFLLSSLTSPKQAFSGATSTPGSGGAALSSHMSSSAHTWDDFQPVGMRYSIEDNASRIDGRHLPKKSVPPGVTTSRTPLVQFTPGSVMPPIGELMYFPFRGRGQMIELILHYGGLAYTLRVVPMDDWPQVKPATPSGVVPVFTPTAVFDDPTPFAETATIAKYVAGFSDVSGLLPADTEGQASAAKLFDMANSPPLNACDALLNFKPASEAAKEMPGYIKEAISTLQKLEPQLKNTGPFFGGATPHYGDLGLFHTVDNMTSLEPKVLAGLGATWTAWYKAISAFPRIQAYLKSRPNAMSGDVGMPGSRIASMPLETES